MVTTLTHYKDGMAAVLIINHTERCDLKFNQRYAKPFTIIEPRHEISNNVVFATSKASDQPVHTRSLIRAFASRLNIL